MLNINSTALRADPIRLIMKMGDDLRQDMITLRMLSLFEKVSANILYLVEGKCMYMYYDCRMPTQELNEFTNAHLLHS